MSAKFGSTGRCHINLESEGTAQINNVLRSLLNKEEWIIAGRFIPIYNLENGPTSSFYLHEMQIGDELKVLLKYFQVACKKHIYL